MLKQLRRAGHRNCGTTFYDREEGSTSRFAQLPTMEMAASSFPTRNSPAGGGVSLTSRAAASPRSASSSLAPGSNVE